MNKNTLAHETSPYLLDHATNPVHWQPWNAQVLKIAQETQKPICLSIGYAACHWCHVMARESFEDQEIANFMNEHFINIKVDREERPDLDTIYMTALHHLGEQGGWPLTMFLKPDGKPFWGGTYFPPEPMFGKPSFIQALTYAHKIFTDDREAVDHNANSLTQLIAPQKPKFSGFAIAEPVVKNVMQRLCDMMDGQNGGMRGAPKFPQVPLFSMLTMGGEGYDYTRAHQAAVHTLESCFMGGIYDHVGGGIHRYAVDNRWLVPHFEKMLYDNALALDLAADLHKEEQAPLFEKRCDEIVSWLQDEMALKGGGFAASLDADQDHEEGKSYIWEYEDVKARLPKDGFARFAQTYDLTTNGNWEGKTILNRLNARALLTKKQEEKNDALLKQLLDIRNKRSQPARDGKLLTNWNGMLIAGLAKAASAYDRPQWLTLARSTYDSIKNSAFANNQLAHCSTNGHISAFGLIDDYAQMIRAALKLYEATSIDTYLNDALIWLSIADEDFWCPDVGGYFTTSDKADDVIIRGKNAADEATPSGNGTMAENLASLYHFTGEKPYLDKLATLSGAFGKDLSKNLLSHVTLVKGNILALTARTILILTNDQCNPKDLQIIKDYIRAQRKANDFVFVLNEQTIKKDNHLINGKFVADNKPTLYICKDQTCSLPLNDFEGIKAQI